VFFARKTLLLGSSDDLSIDDERRCTIMIECGQSKNSHAPDFRFLKECVNKRRDCRTFSEYDKAAEYDHHNKNRHQPIFFSGAQKRPKFAKE
jgi:hypothetical protein